MGLHKMDPDIVLLLYGKGIGYATRPFGKLRSHNELFLEIVLLHSFYLHPKFKREAIRACSDSEYINATQHFRGWSEHATSSAGPPVSASTPR